MITGVRKIVVPTEDQGRAKDFWTRQVGFEVVRDDAYGNGQRWLELAPPDKSVVLVVSQRHPDDRPPSVPDALPHSPILFNTADMEKTYAELTSRGVTFAAAPTKMPFGWWAMFEDQEGTRYALGQW
jgi:lactoylglutathione lyase